MSRVFLSHSHADKKFVTRLAEDLQTHHHYVWLDEAEIRIGDSLIDKIGRALDEVDFVLAVVSATSVKSEWVKKELEIALTREISEKRVVVLPILLTKRDLPPFLRTKKYADFTDSEEYYKNFVELLRALAAPYPQSERDRPLGGNLGGCRRIRLHCDGFVIYRRLNMLVQAYDLLTLLPLPLDRDKEHWTANLLDGYASAAFCFLNFLPSVLLPIVEDAGARGLAVTILMGNHSLALPAPAEDKAHSQKREINGLADFEATCRSHGAYKAGKPLGDALMHSCPAREAMDYYDGWLKFCADLHAMSAPAMSTLGSSPEVVKLSLICIECYEANFARNNSAFWFIVFCHLVNTVADKQVFPPLVEGRSEAFVRDLESKLAISKAQKSKWRQNVSHVGLHKAVFGALIEVKSRFEFTGTVGPGDFELSVVERL